MAFVSSSSAAACSARRLGRRLTDDGGGLVTVQVTDGLSPNVSRVAIHRWTGPYQVIDAVSTCDIWAEKRLAIVLDRPRVKCVVGCIRVGANGASDVLNVGFHVLVNVDFPSVGQGQEGQQRSDHDGGKDHVGRR